MEPGNRDLVSGDVVLEVNGIPRVAYTGGRPFWRPIGLGTQGPDVEEMRAFLRTVGISSTGQGESVQDDDVEAIKTFASSIGTESEVLEPSWLVYLGPAESTSRFVIAPELRVGAQAPPPGSPIGEFESTLVSAQIVASGDETLWDLPTVSYSFQSDPPGLIVEDILEPVTPIQDPSQILDELQGPQVGNPAIGGELTTSEQRVPLVPASSIWIDARGNSCITVLEQGSERPRAIEVLGPRLEGVFISGIEPGETVRALAASSEADATC